MRALPILACAPLLLALAAEAEPATLRLDPSTTKVTFALDSTLHEIHGSLSLREGAITFDEASGAATGQLVLDAPSTTTFKPKRDKKMHSKVLESSLFPRIVFHASRFQGAVPPAGESEVVLGGTLELHGEAHDFELPATISREGEVLTAKVAFDVPYVEWGLRDPSVAFLRVEKVVHVSVEAAGALTAP